MAEFTKEEITMLSELLTTPGYPEEQARMAAGILEKIGVPAQAVKNLDGDNWIVAI